MCNMGNVHAPANLLKLYIAIFYNPVTETNKFNRSNNDLLLKSYLNVSNVS